MYDFSDDYLSHKACGFLLASMAGRYYLFFVSDIIETRGRTREFDFFFDVCILTFSPVASKWLAEVSLC